MEKFLEKIKLKEDFSLKLNTNRSAFVSSLSKNIDHADIDSIFSSPFEAFSSSKNIFKGKVNYSGFKIRKRRRLFQTYFGYAKATGKFTETNNDLKIDITINAWNNFMFLYFGFITIIYLVFFGAFLSGINDFDMPFFAVFFILIHAFFMFGIPFFIMRKNVNGTKQDIEREFVYIINQPTS